MMDVWLRNTSVGSGGGEGKGGTEFTGSPRKSVGKRASSVSVQTL